MCPILDGYGVSPIKMGRRLEAIKICRFIYFDIYDLWFIFDIEPLPFVGIEFNFLIFIKSTLISLWIIGFQITFYD
jgi:hypothetical protein